MAIQDQPASTRKLAAILSADIAGYSAMMGADEEGTVRKLKQVQETVLPLIERFGGRVIDLAGDGILAEFPSAVRAVESAAAVQNCMQELNTQSEPQMLFRIGVNVGDVIHEGERLYGDGINIAARLQAIAPPGGICISNKVHEEVRDRVKIAFRDMGDQELKNIARPVRAFSSDSAITATAASGRASRVTRRYQRLARTGAIISAIGLVVFIASAYMWKHNPHLYAPARVPQSPPEAISRLSLVVTPFLSINAEPKEELLGDAITSDLTNELSKMSGSFVISRATAFTYKGKTIDPKQLGRDLRVRYVLEGTVSRTDDAIRIEAELVETNTASVIWSDRFEGQRGDLAMLRQDFISRVARSLGVELIRADARAISRNGSSDSSAVDQISLGWSDYYQTRTPQSLRSARAHFEAAIALDPKSLEAQTGLAAVIANQTANGLSDSPSNDLARATSLIQDAISRDPENATAYFARGWVMRAKGEGDASLRAYQTALAINPNFSEALRMAADQTLFTGQPKEAIEKTSEFLKLSPRDPNKATALFVVGIAKTLLRDYPGAIVALREARSLNDRLWYIHFNLAAALALGGHIEEGKSSLEEARLLWTRLRSLKQLYAEVPSARDPRYRALAAETIDRGLALLGFPNE